MSQPEIHSEIAYSTVDRITVRGLSLTEEILGEMDVGALSFLQLTGRRPSRDEARMYNAIIVALVEHGITPSALAARLTYTGAPESLQAAIAAGISGLGSTFVGSMEGAARMLSEAIPDADQPGDLDELARDLIARFRARRQPIPGLGHPLHKPIDPRTPRLFAIAEQTGMAGVYTALIERIAAHAERDSGRQLPVNATGAIGAICCQFGFDWRIVRGFGVMARAIGLVGHLQEEIDRPMGRAIWDDVERRVSPTAEDRARSLHTGG